jgi:hypothetical protein
MTALGARDGQAPLAMPLDCRAREQRREPGVRGRRRPHVLGEGLIVRGGQSIRAPVNPTARAYHEVSLQH